MLEKPDTYHWHEALDSTCICMEMVDRYVLFHPVIESNVTLKEKAENAHRLLFEIYQEIGSLMVEEENDK
ncbi:MAG: hypothetical protein M3Y85_00135 [Bacteroidota bacterium]|nr:hypothetical protein [Bacteroidota bacterium]